MYINIVYYENSKNIKINSTNNFNIFFNDWLFSYYLLHTFFL